MAKERVELFEDLDVLRAQRTKFERKLSNFPFSLVFRYDLEERTFRFAEQVRELVKSCLRSSVPCVNNGNTLEETLQVAAISGPYQKTS